MNVFRQTQGAEDRNGERIPVNAGDRRVEDRAEERIADYETGIDYCTGFWWTV